MQRTHFPRIYDTHTHTHARCRTDLSINSAYLLSHNSVVRDHQSPFGVITKEKMEAHTTTLIYAIKAHALTFSYTTSVRYGGYSEWGGRGAE